MSGAGNLYWTCKSAGVTLTRSADTGVTTALPKGLAKPSGISVSNSDDVYFTELPTPGVPNGQNRVSVFGDVLMKPEDGDRVLRLVRVSSGARPVLALPPPPKEPDKRLLPLD